MIALDELRTIAADRTTEHTLPVEENQRIFQEQIVPAELEHATVPPAPTALFLIGQQGAGKTRLSRQRLDEHGAYVNADSDRYKRCQPEYQRLLADSHRTDDPAEELGVRRWSAANHTCTDVNRWEYQVDAYVRGSHVRGERGNGVPHALMQCSGKEPRSIVRRLQLCRLTHERVEAVFLGVPKAVSWQGILYRYPVAVDERGWGRLTGPVSREPSYNGVLELADLVQDLGLADYVAVHRRGAGHATWTHTRASDAGWRGPGRLRTIIERERDRPLTAAESARFITRQRYLTGRMHGEFARELQQINALAQPLLHPDAAGGFLPDVPLPRSSEAPFARY